MTELKIKLSVNPNIIDKHKGGHPKFYKRGWEPRELSLAQLADVINHGYAVAPQFEGQLRRGKNFAGVGFLAIDVDGTLPLAGAMADPFIQQYGSVLYFTPSNGEEGNERYRIIFATETPIERGANFKSALLALATKFNTDRSIADQSRLFFGCKGSSPTIIGKHLPNHVVKSLTKEGRALEKQTRAEKPYGEEVPQKELMARANGCGKATIPASLLIRLASGGEETLGAIPKHTAVFCPYHSDRNPSAFVSSSKLGVPCLCCSTCRNTWWAEGYSPSPYNFYRFDDQVKSLAARATFLDRERPESGKSKWNKEAVIINQRFLGQIDLVDGVTMVKSPKGSGKTTALKKLVATAKQQGMSVLLIGHRQTLLRELAARLKLHCYLDDKTFSGNGKKAIPPDYYAICVDSLPNRLSVPRPYDVVIVDEAEQVFSHITAKTIRSPRDVMTRMQSYVTDARSIYLFDADLNQVTMNFVGTCRKEKGSEPFKLLLNAYVMEGRAYELFPSPSALVIDMLRAARAGKKIFVACNSKSRAKIFHKLIRKDCPEARTLLITAEDKTSDEVRAFLRDPPAGVANYDVVIASPAIGTGIDISFPDGKAVVDIVYGFFLAGINSHYDVDQQLGRVRNPGEVKVWISGRKNTYETDLEAVKIDIVQTGDNHPAVTRYRNGIPVIDMEHPLLLLQATAYSAQRASQNAFKQLFVDHKKRNGWEMVAAKKADKAEAKAIGARAKFIQAELKAELIDGILSAKDIDGDCWKKYFDRRSSGDHLSYRELNEMARFEIVSFYNLPISDDLVRLDASGSYRSRVMAFERLTIHSPYRRQLLVDRLRYYKAKEMTYGEAFDGTEFRSIEFVLLLSGLLRVEAPVSDKLKERVTATPYIDFGVDARKIITKSDLDDFLVFARERKLTFQRDLEIVLRKDVDRDPVKTLNLFLDVIGIELKCLGKTRKGKVASYRYQIDQAKFRALAAIVRARKNRSDRAILPELFDLQSPKPVPLAEFSRQDTIFDVLSPGIAARN